MGGDKTQMGRNFAQERERNRKRRKINKTKFQNEKVVVFVACCFSSREFVENFFLSRS